MNTLAQRLKFAKRELTNLKTAHQRGFGLLKIYATEYKFSDIPGLSPNFYDNATTTINFSKDFAPYPFAYIKGPIDITESDFVFLSVNVEQIEYKNNGYTVVFKGEAVYSSAYHLDKMILYSTSPPISVSFDWRE